MFPDIKLGIEPIKDSEVPSLDDMRKAMAHLIRGALYSARYRGLSGEDTYVLLAYQALIHLEDTHKRLMKVVSLMPPMPPIVMPQEDVPNGLNRQQVNALALECAQASAVVRSRSSERAATDPACELTDKHAAMKPHGIKNCPDCGVAL